jgi:hypothetical protein
MFAGWGLAERLPKGRHHQENDRRNFIPATPIGEMTQLIIKRGNASRTSGQWKDEDYDVLTDGKVIGRILEEGSRFGPPELRWVWSITSIVPASPASHGTASTREEAMAKFRASWRRRAVAGELFLSTSSLQRHSKHFPPRLIGDNDLIAGDISRALVPGKVPRHPDRLLHCLDK